MCLLWLRRPQRQIVGVHGYNNAIDGCGLIKGSNNNRVK